MDLSSISYPNFGDYQVTRKLAGGNGATTYLARARNGRLYRIELSDYQEDSVNDLELVDELADETNDELAAIQRLPSVGNTIIVLGSVLQNLLFPKQTGYYGGVPADVHISGVAAGTDLLSLLPFASMGLVFRKTIIEAFYLYAQVNRLNSAQDRRQVMIDANINAVFNGVQPALYAKIATVVPGRLSPSTEKVANVNGLNTIQALQAADPSYHPRYGTYFGVGQLMGSSDYQLLSSLNYYLAKETQPYIDAIIAQYAQQGYVITVDSIRAALESEYQILNAVRRYYMNLERAQR